jgi:GR25 family glycosyltransferase involved in LPS biosynthesis
MITVNKTFTISLRDQEKRRALAQHEIKKLHTETDWFLADPDSASNSIKGCFASHVSVAKLALQNKVESIMVFEDDVKILPYTKQQIDAINQFINKKTKHFDLLYLGFILGKMWYCGKHSIVRAQGPGLHAYILSPTGIQKMANYHYNNQPIDEVVKNSMKCYSVYPIIAEQQSEAIIGSAISPVRNHIKRHHVKDEQFWKHNFDKQKRRLWGNIHLSIWEFIRRPLTFLV